MIQQELPLALIIQTLLHLRQYKKAIEREGSQLEKQARSKKKKMSSIRQRNWTIQERRSDELKQSAHLVPSRRPTVMLLSPF